MHWLTPTAAFAFKEAGRELQPGRLYAFDDTQAAALLGSGQMVNTPEGPRALGQVVRLRYADEMASTRCLPDASYRSLFIHRAGGFGDLLLLTPALRAFKRAHPGCKVTICTMPRYREVLAGNPCVDAFADFPPTNREIFAHDGVVSFENVIENNPKARTTHAVDLYAERLGVEVDPADRRPDYFLTEEERVWAAAFEPARETGLPRIGMQVKASTPARSCPAGPLSDLVDLLVGEAQVLLFGAPGEVVTDGLNPRIVNLSALKLGFRKSCAMLATCDALVAPDSALCHVAAALEVPTLALYGPFPSHLRLTAACQEAHDAHGVCAPCFHHSRGQAIFPPHRPCARTMSCHVLGSLPPAMLFAATMRLTRESCSQPETKARSAPSQAETAILVQTGNQKKLTEMLQSRNGEQQGPNYSVELRTASDEAQHRIGNAASAYRGICGQRDMPTTKKTISNRKDMLLLLLYSPGSRGQINEPIVGRTRLVKTLFLFKHELLSHFQKGTELTDENFYEFFPWKFGPFSAQVYDDLTFFALRDFIGTTSSQEDALPESVAEWEKWLAQSGSSNTSDELGEYDEESIALTPKGIAFTRPLFESLTDAQRNSLKVFKGNLSAVPLRALLKYVYTKYPDTATKSTIRESLLGHAI